MIKRKITKEYKDGYFGKRGERFLVDFECGHSMELTKTEAKSGYFPCWRCHKKLTGKKYNNPTIKTLYKCGKCSSEFDDRLSAELCCCSGGE